MQDVLLSQKNKKKKTLCVMLNRGNMEHCKTLFTKLGIMTVINIHIYNQLIYVKINLSEYYKRSDIHSYNTRNGQALDQPFVRLKTVMDSCS